MKFGSFAAPQRDSWLRFDPVMRFGSGLHDNRISEVSNFNKRTQTRRDVNEGSN